MLFEILGPLEVVADDGERRDPSARRQRRLLLALLVSRDGSLDVDRLVDLVWGCDERLPERPAGAVRTYITRLRRALELAAGVEPFTSRASAAAPQRGPDPSEADAVEEICRRLDGIPLAIELAAARTSHLSAAAIAGRLDDRFWLLAGSRRGLGRHRTLQATMDWSYELLEEDEQAVLRAAAVFVGRFDAVTLAAVVGRSDHDTLDRLATLVRSSLVEVEVDHRAAQPRYRLLETVRLYAQDRLADTGELTGRRRAHAQHVLADALTHPPRIDDLEPWGTTTEDDTDLGNHLAALAWFDRHDTLPDLGRLVARIPMLLGHAGFIDAAGCYLGRDDVAAALQDPAERALYLTASALNASYLGRFHDQFTFGEAALETARDPVVRAAATFAVANACTIFDPRRIPGLVEDALRELPPSAITMRQELRGQLPLGLVMEGRLAEAADLLQRLMREGDRFAAAETHARPAPARRAGTGTDGAPAQRPRSRRCHLGLPLVAREGARRRHGASVHRRWTAPGRRSGPDPRVAEQRDSPSRSWRRSSSRPLIWILPRSWTGNWWRSPPPTPPRPTDTSLGDYAAREILPAGPHCGQEPSS